MTNTACPDHTSHSENAGDAWVERNGRQPTTVEDFAEIDEAAEVEYRACEGH